MISAAEVRLFQKNNQEDMDYCDNQVRSCMISSNQCVGVIFRLVELKQVEKTLVDLTQLGYTVKVLGEYFHISWGRDLESQ